MVQKGGRFLLDSWLISQTECVVSVKMWGCSHSLSLLPLPSPSFPFFFSPLFHMMSFSCKIDTGAVRGCQAQNTHCGGMGSLSAF
jgi:hypothetical protein